MTSSRTKRTRDHFSWISISVFVDLSLVCLILTAAGCRKPTITQDTGVPVKVKVLTPEEISVSTRFSGSVEPLQSTSLAFKLAGTVQRLYRPPGLNRDVQVGDTLAKGTVIAELDEGDLRRAKASAEAKVAQLQTRATTAKENLAIATRSFHRYEQLVESRAVSKEARDDADSKRISAAGELETAEHGLADALVQLDQANDNYVNRQLLVPFDHATVAEKHIELGERKAAHEVAFRLIDISTVYVNVGVPDTLLGKPAIEMSAVQRVFVGQKLPVTADAFEGRTLMATVSKIAPEADARTRTFLTQLNLPNEEAAPGQLLLRPGMIISVRVGGELDRTVMLLPMAAIHQGATPQDLMVYEVVAENGRDVVRARKVSLGGVYNNQVEVIPANSEVKAGSKVVTTTAERLADGLAVRLMQDDTDTTRAPEQAMSELK
jgi:RND family efflux transporter MFP subunit